MATTELHRIDVDIQKQINKETVFINKFFVNDKGCFSHKGLKKTHSYAVTFQFPPVQHFSVES